MTRRIWPVLLVLFVVPPAHAEDESLRDFIDGLRSDRGRKAAEVVLTSPTEVPRDATLTVEYRAGHYAVSRGIVRCVPTGTHVDVSHTFVGEYLPHLRSLAIRGIGVAHKHATVTPDAYAALVKELLTIRDARLEHKTPPTSRGTWHGTTADGLMRITLRAGSRDLIRVDDVLPISGSRPGRVLAKFGDPERLLMWYRRLRKHMIAWKLTPREVPAAEAATLTRELKALSVDEEQALLLRIRVLGSLGHQPAAQVLRDVRGALPDDTLHDAIDDALTQLRTLRSKELELDLAALLNHPHAHVRDWAHEAMRRKFPKTLAEHLRQLFLEHDADGKREAIRSLAEAAPDDPTLARLGFREKDVRVRLDAAQQLARIEPDNDEVFAFFHATARDKTLRTFQTFHARTGAMEALYMGFPSPKRNAATRATLTAILLDEHDDVGARGCAALGLGYLGDRAAVPALLRVFRSAVPETPVYLHAPPRWASGMSHRMRSNSAYLQSDDVRQDATRALGILRAKEAVAPMVAYLAGAPREDEHNLEMYLAEALGRIADPAARKVLAARRDAQEHQEDRDRLQRHLDILEALNGPRPGAALCELVADRLSDPKWFVLALADTTSAAEITKLKTKYEHYSDYFDEALAIVQGK